MPKYYCQECECEMNEDKPLCDDCQFSEDVDNGIYDEDGDGEFDE